MRSTDDGEPPGSVTMRGEFQGPEKDLPLGKATGLGRERGASARSLTGDLLEAEASSPTGPDAEWPFSLEGRTFGELVNHLMIMFFQLNSKLCLPCSKIQLSGGIFPLPDTLSGVERVVGGLSGDGLVVLSGLCRALNSYYGAQAAEKAMVSEATKMALHAMCSYATDFGLSSEKFEGLRWEQFMAVRGVDYRGEEVKLARRFTWSNIEPALPQGIGCIPLEEVCEGGTLDFVVNLESYLLPLEDMVYTKPPRIFVDPEAWEQVCSGLLERGVCRLLPQSEIFHLDSKPLHNGLFGVSKDEFQDGIEIFRLIMNLVPANKLVRNLGGDISTLPSVVGMAPILMENNEMLVMSSEDIRCFFYLFSVPPVWHKFLSFGREVPASVAPQGAKEPYFLASRVLPMGFASSVAIAQHVHRRVARMALNSMKPHGQGHCELRKDKVFPNSKWLYRIYLDNFDTLELMDEGLASLISGKPSVATLAMREGYLHWGMPRHPKKSVEQELVAEIQGALVDGRTGKVRPKPQKVMKYVELAWLLLRDGWANQKQMQVVCGGFVYCCMFRRAMLGMLNQVWRFITSFEGDPPVVKRRIPLVVQLEMVRFVCAIPLAQMNLRTPVQGGVTASDASESGGGFCISNGLTPMGVHAAGCQVRGDMPEVEDHVQVLSVGLFDGIGALRVGCDVLKLPMAGHVSSEVSKEGNRVVEGQFPDTLHVGDVTLITDDVVLGWASRFSNVGVVVVGGGPPCQGVSGLNADRKGALKDARSKLFVHVKRVYELCKLRFPWAQVHFFMESVLSMDAKDRGIMSEVMGVWPYVVDAVDVTVCRQPRLYWISWEIMECDEVHIQVQRSDSFWESYSVVKLVCQVEPSRFFAKGWAMDPGQVLPTFTTARPRDHPGNKPAGLWQCNATEVRRWKADRHRYPPYIYRDQYCLVNSLGDRRLPNISEKEAAMGFPVGYTEGCLPKGQQKGEGFADVRHSLIGNSWCVQVVAWLLKELFRPLGLTPVASLQEVVRAASPGLDSQLQAYLRRLPLNPVKGSYHQAPEKALTQKLMQFVSVKGEDLLLQADSENQVKFHRLRASVPARLWKWKTVCGWPWKHPGYHINALELQAVLTCLQWRISRKRHHRCRLLHLTDSLVVLHALSRGRSSSRRLRPILSKVNALLLASDVHPVWGYVNTKQNPADRPSRRPVRKRWLKGAC